MADADLALALALQEAEYLDTVISGGQRSGSPVHPAIKVEKSLESTSSAASSIFGSDHQKSSNAGLRRKRSPNSVGTVRRNLKKRPIPGPVPESDSPVSMDMENLADPRFELSDPTPDVYRLFREFDRHFFWGRLACVELKWSPRMTRCAGVCSFQPSSGFCSIRLSRPLLTLRPRSDLVQTLLHEMIHGYLFVTGNRDSRQEHGPEFHRHMWRINRAANVNITVYHTFHEEVRVQLGHWWRCQGACRRRPPYFGFVRRSMNRVPSARDFWWPQHLQTCGGTFVKIREPENYANKRKNQRSDGSVGKRKSESSGAKKEGIRKYFPVEGSGKVPPVDSGESRLPAVLPAASQSSGASFSGGGHRLGGVATIPWYKSTAGDMKSPSQAKPSPSQSSSAAETERVECPVCSRSVPLADVNCHLDGCLTSSDSERLEDDAVAARAMSAWQRSLTSSSERSCSAEPVIVISDDDDEHAGEGEEREPFSEVMRRFLFDEDDDDVLLAEIQT